MRKPTIGAVMIVKNEEERLGGILSDIMDVMDEICIVDTGSSDNTVAIAESFGAKVSHFPWNNDFSAARNHSIACAKSDYLLWLDADDRIAEADQKHLASFKNRLRPQKDRAYMLTILGRSKDMPDTVSLQTRIIPNRPGVRFTGRVHEQVLPSLKDNAIKLESLDITIRHTGYADEHARIGKARRNLGILMEELKDGKDTATQYFFMAMACIGMQDYVQCLEYLTLARQKRTDEDWYHFSYTVGTDCLLRLNRIEDARREIAAGIAAFPESPLLHYYLGSVCMHEQAYSQAAAAFKKASALKPTIDSYPLPPDLRTTALLQHGKALEKLGKTERAIDVYKEGLRSGGDQKALHRALGLALLQTEDLDGCIAHLTTAKDLSSSPDVSLWLSLAQMYLHRKVYDRAHVLYLEILQEDPAHLDALSRILATSVYLDDTESFLGALEQLLITLEIPVPETPVDSLTECADLCMDVASRLMEKGQAMCARAVAEASLLLHPSCSKAHMLLADLYSDQGDTIRMISSLEMALKSGADRNEIMNRIERAQSKDNVVS